MQHTLKIKLSYVTIHVRVMYGHCLLGHVHVTSFDHASNAWTRIYRAMAKSF